MTDEALMMAVAKGDLDKASVLFERYQVKLYNFFLYFIQDAETSEDLTQNVFVRLIKYRESYKTEQSFKAWIYQIARNLKADYFKKQKGFQDKYTDLAQVENQSDSIFSTWEVEEQNAALHRAINRLNEEYKEVIILSKFQQMKYAEIAETLHSNEAAIKVRVHRAVKQLRKFYFAEEAK